ncbi:MAG: cohesin domain-containing protein [Chloroflexota bacterium]
MRGKQFSIGLVLMSLFLVAQVWIVGAQDASPRIWLTTPVEQATAGQEFTVTVNVEGASQVYGGSFQLLYDTQSFEVVVTDSKAVNPGAFFGDAPSFPLKNSADTTGGTVDYALTLTQPAQPVSGDGVLGTVTFRALKDASVSIVAAKASLVSPEFTQVDGRLIAQKINQVEAQIGETVVDNSAPAEVASAPVSAVVEQPAAVVVAPTADTATASVSVSASANQTTNDTVLSAPVSNAPAVSERQMNSRVLIAAGLFFLAGLVLLIVSVGMYSKMRVRFDLSVDNMPEHSL